jgi:peroxiredoxin
MRSKCRNPITALLVVAALAAAALLGAAGCNAAGPSAANGIVLTAAGKRAPAPPLSGDLLGGGRFVLAEHAGDVVVVNFWGAWCAPCVAEADDLEQTYQQLHREGVSFVGVNVRDQRDSASRFLAAHQISYPSVFDPSGHLALGFAVPPTAIPSTVLVDRQGRVAAVIARPVLRSQLEPIVRDLAAETAAAGSPAAAQSSGGAGG